MVVSVLANTFSIGCDLQADWCAVETLAELETAVLQDRIVVLHGELSRSPIMPLHSAVYLPKEHRRLGTLLREKRPLAIVLVSQTPDYCVPLLEDWRLDIPSVTLAAESADALFASPHRPLRITIDSSLQTGSSANIVASNCTIVQPRVVVCAHYDSKPYTVGAFDNASGVAALLALAELLQPNDGLGIEFIAFSGEEFGLGDDTYLAEYGLGVVPFGETPPISDSQFEQIKTAVNIDGIGIGQNNVAIFNESPELEHSLSAALAQNPAIALASGWPASNHYTFYSHGIPTLALNATGGDDLIHHERDSLDKLELEKIAEVMRFVASLLGDFAKR
ncbi:MAG: M20/M25/M40 family metallo-hydrolase [Chloroflexota bacterium]